MRNSIRLKDYNNNLKLSKNGILDVIEKYISSIPLGISLAQLREDAAKAQIPVELAEAAVDTLLNLNRIKKIGRTKGTKYIKNRN